MTSEETGWARYENPLSWRRGHRGTGRGELGDRACLPQDISQCPPGSRRALPQQSEREVRAVDHLFVESGGTRRRVQAVAECTRRPAAQGALVLKGEGSIG